MNTNINATTATDSTAQEILDKLKTVDGAGSGLDADLVQGKDVYSTISNPNLLINGDFQVWQRGESFTATS